ncbi:hypothetical protein ACGFYP_30165 [Streptomyces sp. NPDC048370]|uniref:hypothetical protein n=1 Tax=Streptomyces sp. NPDC048370 TaxID=3365540 RepID=UPI003717C1AC
MGVIEHLTPSLPEEEPEEPLRPGPLWRHTLWVVGITAGGVALGWTTGLFPIGLDPYGLPSTAPGSPWPYLLFWTAVGLALAAVLRATAARVPLYAPGRIAGVLTLLGTRLSLGWRPETPVLIGMAAAALATVAVWCVFALRSTAVHRRRVTSRTATGPADGTASPDAT